jgi:coenzyme F420 biosynthesis associated uncharacterized protein
MTSDDYTPESVPDHTSDEPPQDPRHDNPLGTAVDWQLAAKTGVLMSRPGPNISRGQAEQAVAELSAAARRAEAPVREVTGLAGGLPVPGAQIVDRRGWITAAAASLATMTEADASEPTRMFAGKPAGVQAGAMLAFLSSAILGQYDPFTGSDGTLLLVAPNIVAAERTLGVRPADFRLWVCLHEVTHRVQFAAVPWLADYLRGTIATLTRSTTEPVSEIVARLAEELKERRTASPDERAAQGGVIGLLRATQGPAQRAALDRILVLGTLLEGHADHVMDAVGPAVVPSVEQIRKAFDDRRERPHNPLQRLLRALLGMDAKLAQYVRGKAFVDAVVAQVGMRRFNTIWTSADTLPLPAEIDRPGAWAARVLG